MAPILRSAFSLAPTSPTSPTGRPRRFLPSVVLALALTAALLGGAAPPAVGQSATSPSSRGGQWLVAADGGVFALGTAPFRGSAGALRLDRPIVGAAATVAGSGYWLVASDGGIVAFGDARFFGSTGGLRLNRPIVGMASTPSGAGYWLVASDGGIFAFGDARFRGSLGSLRLNRPIVGMASTPSGLGYWLVASDGGVFAFGDARFAGSGAGRALGAPVVGMAGRSNDGYWVAAADGTVLAFGSASILAQPAPRVRSTAVVAVVISGAGYNLIQADGAVLSFGGTGFGPSPPIPGLRSPVVGAASPSAIPGQSLLPGTYVERPDQQTSVVYSNGVPTQFVNLIADCFCARRVSFSTTGRPGPGNTTLVEARIINITGVPMEFPGGLDVRFRLTRNGTFVREVVAANPAIVAFPPGATATASFTLVPEGDGRYEFGGEVTVLVR
ncbi:MAG: hypothetical protein ACRDY5_00320 [Acidimicrobiales bacterium]